jgi:serine/threonine protein kinase
MDQYIGKLLDNRYEILEVMGVGGMAVVYKARCHRLNRLVAIKILRSDLAQDAEFRRRFHDESQAVAMLSHPNIVAVYDVSRASDLEYIVMELVDGITLKQYMQKKGAPLNWREALHFIIQIIKALSHAHSRGIIHRDIKPQNIMVLRDGSVKVTDFGIARLASAAQSTLTQEALGSVHYISPEQARGSRIDARSDLYSAGVVLYEMLTGRLPYEGDTPVSVAIQHINSIPLAPREINPDIPEALEAITMKAMASNVEQRYASADDMLIDLEEFRKNPNINFDFNAKDILAATDNDEPTQVIGTGAALNKQRGRSGEAHRSHRRTREDQYDEDDYDDSREDRGSRWSIFLAIGALLIFLVGIGYFLWVSFLSGLLASTPEYTVPDLRGKTVAEARMDPNVNGIFEIIEGESQFSEEYEANQIISQTPDADTKLKGEELTITVTVSKGAEYVSMPNVTNKPYLEALIQLQNLGLVVPTPEYQTSDSITKGYVIESLPLEGVQMSPGDEVKLIVSQGPEVKKVTVLSFIDQTLEEAQKIIIQDLNLNLGTVTQVSSDKPAGVVVYQSIPAGTEVDAGSTITLQVSKGPDTPPTPTPEPTTTPTPPPATSTPDQGIVTYSKKIPITVPTDKDSVKVRIEVGGETKWENTVSSSMGTIYPAVPGSGVQEISIYFDNELVDRYSLDFSSSND